MALVLITMGAHSGFSHTGIPPDWERSANSQIRSTGYSSKNGLRGMSMKPFLKSSRFEKYIFIEYCI